MVIDNDKIFDNILVNVNYIINILSNINNYVDYIILIFIIINKDSMYCFCVRHNAKCFISITVLNIPQNL